MHSTQPVDPQIYQGQFGSFKITETDHREVLIYRMGLLIAALSLGIGSVLVIGKNTDPLTLGGVTVLYACFSLALAVSLLTIHIYLVPLHRTLQIFWLIGTGAALGIELSAPEPLALTVYQQPLTILGMGFTFAALTGIFFKEAFCFNCPETKLLTPLVPVLLLGSLFGWLSVLVQQILLAVFALLFLIYALRKFLQPVASDIGDKSVFDYLKKQAKAR